MHPRGHSIQPNFKTHSNECKTKRALKSHDCECFGVIRAMTTTRKPKAVIFSRETVAQTFNGQFKANAQFSDSTLRLMVIFTCANIHRCSIGQNPYFADSWNITLTHCSDPSSLRICAYLPRIAPLPPQCTF